MRHLDDKGIVHVAMLRKLDVQVVKRVKAFVQHSTALLMYLLNSSALICMPGQSAGTSLLYIDIETIQEPDQHSESLNLTVLEAVRLFNSLNKMGWDRMHQLTRDRWCSYSGNIAWFNNRP